LSTDTRPRPSPVSPRGKQWFIGAGLAGLVVLAIALRLEPILVEPSAVWPDEIFQASEPAHRLVYGSGLVAWEFQLGVRSWILPGAIAALMELARIAGDGPGYYLPLIAGVFAALAAAPVICSFLWCRPLFGTLGALLAGTAMAVAPELVYFGARTLSEVVAAHLLVIALYVLEPGHRVTSFRRLFAGGALLGLVFVTRIQLAPAVAIVALWTNWRPDRERVFASLAGAAVILIGAGMLDTLTLGYPFASLWRYIVYNLYYGVSSTFGVEPWNYYLLGELGVWGGACATFLLLAILGAFRRPLPLVVAVGILVAHSAIAHKEYRFIYPAVLLLMVLGSIGLAQIAGWAHDWLIERGKPRTLANLAGSALVLGWWCLASYQVWNGPTLVNHRQRMHDRLVAASYVAQRPAVCGIGLYGLNGEDWGVYGGYTYFHRPVPMYWPKDETALTVAADGFDTLLYTQPPPPALGFNPLLCIGEVCVAQRAGECRSIPMTPIALPDALIESGVVKPPRLFSFEHRNVTPDPQIEGAFGTARSIAGKTELIRPHDHE
jgi:phosphatidylinositol glycan class B